VWEPLRRQLNKRFKSYVKRIKGGDKTRWRRRFENAWGDGYFLIKIIEEVTK
jgi:hypothetical protein